MDEGLARLAAEQIPNGVIEWGLDGPIPEGTPGHKVEGIATELREFPTRYITPDIETLLRYYRLHSSSGGASLMEILHWPARLVRALDFIDHEVKARRAHHG